MIGAFFIYKNIKGVEFMRLELVKQGEFLGTKCDFYKDEDDNIYMSRTQIGYALGYANPSQAILVMHQRHKERIDKFSVEVTSSQFERTSFNGIGKNKKAFMYNERGIYAICGYSNMEVAEQFNDWVYEVIISIRKNGYYIATEKDEQWLGVRTDSKRTRREFTDEVQEFVYYAQKNGCNKPNMYYMHFTKLVNEKLGIPKGTKREDLDQGILMDIMALERVMSMKLPKLINKEMNYKEIYKEIKKLIEII